MTELEIKQALTRTWVPFFSRFGRLTRVQVDGIPLILGGANVVIISPSASGKTEAVVAPIVERLLPARANRVSVLYVSPTRALVNDLFRRLSEPLEYLELTLSRKTGDHPTIDEGKLPFMLITTPESLDSLLCRHTRIFQQVSAVVLDELHLLDNTPRGDQLRVLLERLRLIKKDVQFCALSATIDDERIGERYFPNPRVVKVTETREIEQLLLPMKGDYVGRVYNELEKRGANKVLFFFNARSLVEMHTRSLDRPPFAGKVWAHHASLTKRERENVEQLMTSERRGVLCATSTLELGIDIGDVDAVVLFRPPFSISSLLQRIGRGNRRNRDRLFAVGLFLNEWERLLFEVFLDCARKGKLYEKRYNACRSVLPQQAVSYLFQRRRIGTTLAALDRVLAPVCPDTGKIQQMFSHLIGTECVRATRRGIYSASAGLEAEIVRGKIHSNIQEKSFGDFEVVDSESNAVIGRVFYLFERFALAGRTWEVVERREKEKKVYVRCIGALPATAKVFEGTGTGGYYYLFSRQIKARLFPRLAEDEFPFFLEGGEVHLYHFLGELYGSLLCEALAEKGIEAEDQGGRLLVWSERAHKLRDGEKAFPIPAPADFRAVISRKLTYFEDRLGSGAFFRLLPRHLQIDDHFQALDIAGLLKFLRSARVRQVEPPRAAQPE